MRRRGNPRRLRSPLQLPRLLTIPFAPFRINTSTSSSASAFDTARLASATASSARTCHSTSIGTRVSGIGREVSETRLGAALWEHVPPARRTPPIALHRSLRTRLWHLFFVRAASLWTSSPQGFHRATYLLTQQQCPQKVQARRKCSRRTDL